MKVKPTRYGDYEKTVKFDLFSRYMVHVVFTDSLETSFRKRYPTSPFEWASEAQGFHVKPSARGHAHIFLPHNVIEGSVAHECWHAIREMLLNWIHANADLDNEVVAYCLGYLVGKVYEFKSAVVIDVKRKEESHVQ
jgi:hypothetical protein